MGMYCKVIKAYCFLHHSKFYLLKLSFIVCLFFAFCESVGSLTVLCSSLNPQK